LSKCLKYNIIKGNKLYAKFYGSTTEGNGLSKAKRNYIP
jgi:hypothetical protein